ncbi:unnamed protein product [Linum trigynum]|uniref:Uncharacterized protein n=1 Tax=Linum trigynum TaxID=586398 RepID=A0AAV2CSV6_9ROSI
MELSCSHNILSTTAAPQYTRESVDIRPNANPQHSMVQTESIIKEATFSIPTNKNIPGPQIPLAHSPKNIPSTTYIAEPHKPTQQRISKPKTQRGQQGFQHKLVHKNDLPCVLSGTRRVSPGQQNSPPQSELSATASSQCIPELVRGSHEDKVGANPNSWVSGQGAK